MGADLVGYLIIGPKEISVEKANEAAKKLWERVQSSPYFCHVCNTPNEPGSKFCTECNGNLSYYKKLNTYEDCYNVIMKFVESWPLQTRDSVFRFIDEDRIVIFAGETSWGDAPSGQGYKLLSRAEVLGFDQDLGLQ